eukprot:5148698-Amphidinium_carterae.1
MTISSRHAKKCNAFLKGQCEGTAWTSNDTVLQSALETRGCAVMGAVACLQECSEVHAISIRRWRWNRQQGHLRR